MNHMQLYLKEITNFLSTVMIKSDFFKDYYGAKYCLARGLTQSDSIRTILSESNHTDYLNRRVFIGGEEVFLTAANYSNYLDYEIEVVINPYLRHLCGEVSEDDTPMYIVSLDTGETIQYTRDILSSHPKTIAAYKMLYAGYEKLTQRYPAQYDLIKCITYPISLKKAVEAPEFTLLNYDSTILNSREHDSMINALTEFLTMFRDRWIYPQFNYEEYVPRLLYGIIWDLMTLVLLECRINNIRTSAVHPVHIWDYLTSRGYGKWRGILNEKQAHSFYRNARWIEANKGKQKTLEFISQILFEDLDITLRTKSIILDSTGSTVSGTTPKVISEDLTERTETIKDLISGTEEYDDLFQRIYNSGLEPKLSSSVIDEQKSMFRRRSLSWRPTKMIELTKRVRDSRYLNMFRHFVLDSLFSLYRSGKLRYNLSITIPYLDTQTSLSVGEAIALWIYCEARSRGTTLTQIPNSTEIHYAFMETPENVQMSELFYYQGNTYRTADYFSRDKIVSYLNEMPTICQSSTELINLMDYQFALMVELADQMNYASLVNRLITESVLREYTQQRTIDVTLLGYEEYLSWFALRPELTAMLTEYDADEDASKYDQLGNAIYNAILPLDLSKYSRNIGLSSTQYQQFKELLASKNSYNIAFIDSAIIQRNFTPLGATSIYYKDRELHHFPQFIVPNPVYRLNHNFHFGSTHRIDIEVDPRNGIGFVNDFVPAEFSELKHSQTDIPDIIVQSGLTKETSINSQAALLPYGKSNSTIETDGVLLD